MVAFVFLFAFSSHAQTLFVSDIDDTVKLANIKDISDSAIYAFDDESRFTGMNFLYNAIAQDNSGLTIAYLSRAPEWFMKNTHTRFLVNGQFPQGHYIGRTNYSSEEHKLKTLRALLESIRPRKVILIGDNGEFDPDVYAQIVNEYANQGIEFHQFIRIVYSETFFLNKATALQPGQVGFVTPAEIALELEKARLLSTTTVQALLEVVVKDILKPRRKAQAVSFPFPEYVDCRDFKWQWDESLASYPFLSALKTRIENRCGTKVP
ncbi:MAG: DUF2183 domain-containing protein [Bdellovibrio sp.]|nr:DUF2183 domain-containing protein [Bdellovibrio sp.]